MFNGPPSQSKVVQQYQKEIRQELFNRRGNYDGQLLHQGPKTSMPKYQAVLIDKLRDCIKKNGNSGIIALARLFKQCDLDGSQSINQYEFNEAIRVLRLDIGAADIATLFKCFDRDGNGSVDYNEFLKTLRGPLPIFRQEIVLRIFKSLDIAKDGRVSL